MFEVVRPKKISDQVFEQLRDLIFRGQLKPGQQILPERELAQSMGVSRPTVRAAINKLVDRGLLEHRQGQGTFVRQPRSDQDNNPLKLLLDGHEASLVELLEVRLGLECNAAALAARRASEEDIRLIEKSLKAMREKVEKGGLAFEEDAHFHMCIAYASKNPVQIHIMKHLYDLLRFGIRENLAHLYESPANIRAVIAQHEKVLGAIKGHDTQAAFEGMLQHINFVVDFFAGRPTLAV
ncbi:MAG: FadR family transcriptional regulator [Desulfarculus sp.]|nr:FadR family transcriptional regulator [Desulfarculus sp.]